MGRRGFTLIETMIVLALVVLIFSVGQLVSITYLRTQQLRTAADLTVSELRLAQTDAYVQTNDAAHGLKVFTDHLVRFQGATYASRDPAKDVRTDFAGSLTLSGASEVDFPLGSDAPTSASTITLDNGKRAEDIVINTYGVITVTERTIGN